ncbi:MAG: hypothetical protein DHS20C11_13240 [Lysobacteraceae bacterium]|nr:MAG: hypothetical protein DHS20C11_13240 [Xanthomonadaceae bacterium]
MQPVSFGFDNFSEIAEKMVSTQTGHSLGSSKMLELHAARLDEAKAGPLPRRDQCSFRKDFWGAFMIGTGAILEDTSVSSQARSNFENLKSWVSQTVNPENFTQTQARRWVETNWQGDVRMPYLAIDSLYQFAFAQPLDSSYFGLADGEDSTKPLLALWNASEQRFGDSNTNGSSMKRNLDIGELITNFPLSVLEELPLGVLVELRETPAFARLRAYLNDLIDRKTTANLSRAKDAFDDCAEAIREVLEHKDARMWKEYKQKIGEELMRITIKQDETRALRMIELVSPLKTIIRISTTARMRQLQGDPVSDLNLQQLKVDLANLVGRYE